MQSRMLATAALLALAAPALVAQEARQQDRSDVTVPAYTDQQRWNRAAFLVVSFATAGIAEAKARGQQSEHYGRFLGDLFAPHWGPRNTGYAVRMARRVHFNLAAYPGSEAKMVSASDTAATLRYRRFHVPQFGPERQVNGVTLDEYDRAFVVLHERIASHLGLRYEERVDGNWNVVTIRGRGSAAVVDFPRARHAVTLSADDVTGQPGLAGTWELSFGSDGRYTVRHNGEAKVQGTYKLRLDEIAVGDETGPIACSGPATYRWNVNARGELTLGRLADACDGRAGVYTTRPLSRK